MLSLQDLTLRYGERTLLERVSVTIHAGQRVGVIGKNGVGKSTLLAAIRGEMQADGGSVDLPRSIVVASVSQETPALPQAAIDYALDGDTELRTLEARIGALEQQLAEDSGNLDAALDALSAAHDRMATIDGYAAQARAAQLLYGLGFSHEVQQRPVASFSGGWRMRLNLARALLKRSDLLLLDEPTNHLDMDAALWLQEELAVFPGTLLLISHDRDFIDAVCTHTLHLERAQATLYAGGYSQFERQRAERLAQQQQARDQQLRKAAHLRSFIDRFKTHASKARQAQSRIKALERMEMVAPVLAENPFDFSFRKPERVPSPLIHITHGRVGYPGKILLSRLKLSLEPGERVALLGANGAGKSTLIRSLAGPDAGGQDFMGGEIVRSPDLRVGYYAQHQLEQLDPAASGLLHLKRIDPRASEQSLRDYLGQFAFHGERQLEPIAPFSGGEKARLALALVVYQRPNLLLLDEPTNHLDLDMRQALEMALNDYPGAVVLVSHDRHLVENVCDTLWRVADESCAPFEGDLDDYAQWLRDARRKAQKGTGAVPAAVQVTETVPAPVTTLVTAPPVPAMPALDSKQRREQLRALDKQMARLNDELKSLEARLADADLYVAARRDEMQKLSQRQSSARAELSAAEEQWLQISEQVG